MGILSPFFRTLPLAEHGLRWLRPRASVAHPLDDEPAVLLRRSLDDTAAGLGGDARAYRAARRPVPRRSARAARRRAGAAPASRATRSACCASACAASAPATGLARLCFRGERARALLAGCAAHSILPLDRSRSPRAVGLIFAITGARRGLAGRRRAARRRSAARSRRTCAALGGRDRDGRPRRARSPTCRRRASCLFDTSPGAARARSPATRCPRATVRRLAPLPLRPRRLQARLGARRADPVARPALPRGVDRARRRHARGDRAPPRRAVWRGEHPERPFLIVCQQSQFDPTRAPAGKHTGYAYCHVPAGSTVDMTRRDRAQIERFAPGFRDRILARHAMTPGRPRARQPELRRRRDHRRRRRRVPALHAPGRAPRSVHDAEPAPVPLLGLDAARRRRARHVRLPRRRLRAAPAAAPGAGGLALTAVSPAAAARSCRPSPRSPTARGRRPSSPTRSGAAAA